MAASPEIQQQDKSTLLQPDWPPMKPSNGVAQPVTSGNDMWFIQYMF